MYEISVNFVYIGNNLSKDKNKLEPKVPGTKYYLNLDFSFILLYYYFYFKQHVQVAIRTSDLSNRVFDLLSYKLLIFLVRDNYKMYSFNSIHWLL